MFRRGGATVGFELRFGISPPLERFLVINGDGAESLAVCRRNDLLKPTIENDASGVREAGNVA